ncbi:MAG: nucleic acid-binding protein [Pirellula sp.]|nr:nucleic acid-binding protein [Pirellula sp.]
MRLVFADAFYFLAVINPDDAYHREAMAYSEANKRPLLTTDWVLAEVADAFAKTPHRGLARQLYFDLRDHLIDVVVPSSRELFEQGFELYHSRPDKGWSLTDCISFEVMREHGVTEALTGDRHFAQAGFTPLFAS